MPCRLGGELPFAEFVEEDFLGLGHALGDGGAGFEVLEVGAEVVRRFAISG